MRTPWNRRMPRWLARDSRPHRCDYAAAARDRGTWRFAFGAAGVAVVLLGLARTFVSVAGSMFVFWAMMAAIGTFHGSAETHARERERRLSG